MELANALYLTDIMHLVSQALLTPVIVLLLALIAYSLWCIGSIVVETFTERLNYKVNMPQFLGMLSQAPVDQVPQTIATSGLLNRQKASMLTLWDYRFVPEDTGIALARRLVATEDQRYKRIVARNDTATKIAPMFGLMGTLIPLGPGIVALGQGDTSTLSASLGVAFDTTVSGLIAAAVCFVVSRIRKNWYENYMTSLETAMTTLLEVIQELRIKGQVGITEPDNSLERYGLAHKGHYRQVAEQAIEQKHEEDQDAWKPRPTWYPPKPKGSTQEPEDTGKALDTDDAASTVSNTSVSYAQTAQSSKRPSVPVAPWSASLDSSFSSADVADEESLADAFAQSASAASTSQTDQVVQEIKAIRAAQAARAAEVNNSGNSAAPRERD